MQAHTQTADPPPQTLHAVSNMAVIFHQAMNSHYYVFVLSRNELMHVCV